MSSLEKDITALKAEIAKYERLFDAATTPEERVVLGNIITAKQNTLTELIKLSGIITDCDFNNPAAFNFWN